MLAVDRETAPSKTPETLPGEAGDALKQMGCWERFGALRFPVIAERSSTWGGPERQAISAVLKPYGLGWLVDRERFDAMLRDHARERGAVLLAPAHVRSFTASPPGWEVSVDDEVVRARWLIDASGRACWAARRLGAPPVRYDGLVGAYDPARFAGGEPARVRIDAAENGWTYEIVSAGSSAKVFFTDADLLASTGARVLPAHSQRAAHALGERWLAVGDALAAHDPLSSSGVVSALRGALGALDVILERDGARGRYAARAQTEYVDYLARRKLFYRAETRWPASPFWRRRADVPARG
ncbi:MAG: hypothetical protein JWM87_3705 [Candidatus Eremiobacteraeota bacterium]|nr:hypothetical protein [Candidatus Eremiobacteraeota bacterium]